MQLTAIDTGHFKLDGGAMFGVVPKSLWNKLNPADDNNMCSWAMRCLLATDGNKTLLVDSGIGNKQSEKFFSFYFLHGDGTLEQSLHRIGVGYDDVTHNLLTHLHFDHVGGSVISKDGIYVPTFSNATYLTNQAHWLWAIEPNAREKASFLKENILPMKAAGQLDFIETPESGLVDASHIFPELELYIVNGHTERMMLPIFSYKGRKVAFCADLLPSSAHIQLPYIMAYDMRPLVTLSEKEAFLKLAVANDWVLFFEHDPVVECATVKQTEQGIRLAESFKLAEL